MEFCRKINLIGDVDETMYSHFIEQLDGMQEIGLEDTIYIELCSHGGDAMIALAIYDRIRLYPGEVIINAFGTVQSAAVLILAAGDKRLMAKNAWVMVHEDTTFASKHDRVTQVEKIAFVSRQFEEQWNKLLSSRTGTPASHWGDLHTEEVYLTAAECKTLGLIDKIMGER